MRPNTGLPLLLCLCMLGATAQDSLPKSNPSEAFAPLPTDTTSPSARQLRARKWVIGGSSVGSIVGLYVYLKNAWWADFAPGGFRFDWGRDYRYANNLDKMGHFVGGIMMADAYYDAFRWTGMSERQAAWWGFGMGTGLQMAIEIKDGFSPDWGFSLLDVTLGSAGALMPLLRQKSSFFNHTDFKFSHWKRSDKYFNVRSIPPQKFHIDDYLNQTYWISTNLRYMTGNRATWIPDWLNLSFGWGIEAESWNTNPNNPGTGGKPEFYIAPDIDLVRLFKPKKPFWQLTLKRLNYIKFPMPTLQISQRAKLWPIYF